MTLVDKIAAHLTEQNRPPVTQLQRDLLKLKQSRLEEVITLKQRPDGGVYHSDLMKALKQKGLTLDDVTDNGYVIKYDLTKHNIILA